MSRVVRGTGVGVIGWLGENAVAIEVPLECESVVVGIACACGIECNREKRCLSPF
jgi:hypothetical protein